MQTKKMNDLEKQMQEIYIYQKHHGGTVRKLMHRMQRARKTLKESYLGLREKKSFIGWEQWLLDNYYSLEGHAKQILADLKGYSKASSALYRFYGMIAGIYENGTLERLAEDPLIFLLHAISVQEELSERQLDFLHCALKTALFFTAANACADNCDDSRREQLVSYAVIGMVKLEEIDFDRLTCRCSQVELIFRADPAGIYPGMASQSRRYYRCAAARIAQKTGLQESEVARDILKHANDAQAEEMQHVGYYLMKHDPQTVFSYQKGVIVIASIWIGALLLAVTAGYFFRSILTGVLLFFPLVELLRIIFTDLSMRQTPARHIPRMKLSGDAPKTVIAVSTLLPDVSQAGELEARLTQLYFSNKADNLYYCVLADFKEDRHPYNPQDDLNVGAAKNVVESLNKKYDNRFMLYVRRRVFTKTQGKYSGWERKRGAITEFIRFIKGGETTVLCFAGDRKILPRLKYVIALDSDTNLSFDSANNLVAAAVHPLNRPVIGKDNIVTSGYGILVPAIGIELSSAKQTDFTCVMNGVGGISTYEQESCDFYQDLFGEAIFSGKGLIDIDVFHKVVGRRFPENTVLSHDILEGAFLRVGLVSDVEMTDGTPANLISWFARLHRWIRGDWQNILFLGKQYKMDEIQRPNPINKLSRYKMIDNLRRSAVPAAALLCLIGAGFVPSLAAVILCMAGIGAVSFGPLWTGLRHLISGGNFAVSRRYFAHTLPRVAELLGQAALSVIIAAEFAVVALDAIVRTLWRLFVSKKNLLQWVTASQAETKSMTLGSVMRRSWRSELMGAALVLFSPLWPVKVLGILFLIYAPAVLLTARPLREMRTIPDQDQRDQLLAWCAQMFAFYEHYANEENNFLPPDNVQFSPTDAIARRTSPTNIGMMLLSVLAARDFHFIDSKGLYERVIRTLNTIQSLETKHGNLYNWYATDTLEVLPDYFVSSVDSGNYLCALVALKEGLSEYAGEEPRLADAIKRIEEILQSTDLSVFYNKSRRLFSIGIDQAGHLNKSHYDFLMSEARTMSYYAVATRQADYKHWRALNRTMSRNGVYAGPVSWTGTMFEYYMPHLLLPIHEGSLLGEAMQYALYCQKKQGAQTGVPWGISESGYYCFDASLNYQYKAHGVQKLGVKQGLDQERVISPYSSFLVLGNDLDGAMKNLMRLEAMGATGRYGFYEAVDFTPSRTEKEGAIVRSYMAHHVGMSMIACANVLFENRMQKRFMRNPYMGAAGEFLQEKISKDTVVYDLMEEQPIQQQQNTEKFALQMNPVSVQNCGCTLLTNHNLTQVQTETGAGWLRIAEYDVTRRPTDYLAHPQGIIAMVRANGSLITPTVSPAWQKGEQHSCAFTEKSAVYTGQKDTLTVTQTFELDQVAMVAACTVAVENAGKEPADAKILFYFEPVLAKTHEYLSHPAFSKLFVTGEYDKLLDMVRFQRKNRDGTEGYALAAGLLKTQDSDYLLGRERVTPYPLGLEALQDFDTMVFDEGTATPDGCFAMRTSVTVPPGGNHAVTLLLSVGMTNEEAAENLISVRQRGISSASAPLMNDSVQGRLGMRLLPYLVMAAQSSKETQKALAENTRGQDALWSLGISGDYPIVIFDWARQPDRSCLDAYVSLYELLKRLRLQFDLCVLHTQDAPQGLPPDCKLIDGDKTDQATLTALYAAACYHTGFSALPEKAAFTPMPVMDSAPADIPQKETRFDVVGGAYLDGRFYVDRVTPLPFSHILANDNFGTLLSDASLGNTWYGNARECKLSPWNNDIATGNDGERMLLSVAGACYDLCRGARASFSSRDACYEGKCGAVRSSLRVTIAAQGAAKYMDVALENPTDEELEIVCAYYLEPVLGVTRLNAKYTQMNTREGCLLLKNPYHMDYPCAAAIYVPQERPSYTSNRAAFLSGDWGAAELAPNNDPVAGTIVRKKLPPRRKEQIRFILSAADDEKTAISQAKQEMQPPEKEKRSIEILTPDEALNQFINTFAPHQIIAGRLRGRTAFYQCSGAYGFRDQLQDAGAYILIDPAVARTQILRCCAVQFEEGDVLHWWHDLPSRVQGVRTTFSDDLLWLPYTVCDYLQATGDDALLEEIVPYCRGEALSPGEQERYQQVTPSAKTETVYEHCIRAIDRASNLGSHGIPKIGCGDWNDGFSAIGVRGSGESVWLAMFLSIVLDRFADVCQRKMDTFRASGYRGSAAVLRSNIDRSCWDGHWYLRAFYDDGVPLGGKACDECRIDLLSQSFAVLCGMPDPERVNTALDSAAARLVDYEKRIVRLFAPPFEKTDRNPGYIKSYPPGIRENGGQYTHAAVWFALAILKAGRVDEGYRLLDMLNPTSRCTSAKHARAFKTEPYYMPADIYTNPGAYGHGGWSIYTGAAAWYYRTVISTLLGLAFHGDHLTFDPHIPKKWSHFEMTIQEENWKIHLICKRTGNQSLTVDGQPALRIPFDGRSHEVVLTL